MKKRFLYAGSGGGSLGAQITGGIVHLTRDRGVEYEEAAGLSVSAIISAAISTGQIKNLHDMFLEISDRSVYKGKIGLGSVARAYLPLFQRNYLTDWRPLKKLLRDQLRGKTFEIPCWVGVTNLTTGLTEYKNVASKYYTLSDKINLIYASCAMILIAKSQLFGGYEYVDGGLTDINPAEPFIKKLRLKNPMEYELHVFNCHKQVVNIKGPGSWPTLHAMAGRGFDIMRKRMGYQELRKMELINALAEKSGGTWTDPHTGKTYHYIEYCLFEPVKEPKYLPTDFGHAEELFNTGMRDTEKTYHEYRKLRNHGRFHLPNLSDQRAG